MGKGPKTVTFPGKAAAAFVGNTFGCAVNATHSIDNPDFISNADFSVFSAITKKLLAGKLRPLTRSNRVVTVGFGTV